MKNKIGILILMLCMSVRLSAQKSIIYLKQGQKIYCDEVDIRYNSVVYYIGKKQKIEPKENVYRVFKINGSKVLSENVDEDLAMQAKIGISLYTSTSFGIKSLLIGDVVKPEILSQTDLRLDDEITHIDGIPLSYFSNLENDVFEYGRTGDYIEITVNRGGKSYKGLFYYYKITKVETDDETGKTVTYLDISSVSGVQPVKTRTKSGSSEDYVGVYLTFQYGVGGWSFANKDPLKFVYEFELGHTNENNFSNAFKFSIYENWRENREKTYAFNYRFMKHMGSRLRSGFFIGGDLGVVYIPNANGFLWQIGMPMGYDFHIVNHLRIGIIGNAYMVPTYNFTNIAFGGYGGIRISGIL